MMKISGYNRACEAMGWRDFQERSQNANRRRNVIIASPLGAEFDLFNQRRN